jgi:hypothetical protein
MTYTSHGHYIPGSPEDPQDPPPQKNCGGVGLCGLCSSQAIVWRKEAERLGVLEGLDSKRRHEGILAARVFEAEPVRVNAVQFVGGASNGMDCEAWVKSYGGNATWRNEIQPWSKEDGSVSHDLIPEMLTVETPGGWQEAVVGSWIVQGVEGEFYPVTDETFRQKYREVNGLLTNEGE